MSEPTGPRDELAEGLRGLLGRAMVLLGLRGEVVIIHTETGIQFGIRLPAPNLRILTGEDGRTWQAFVEIVNVIGRRHGIKLTLSIIDPPGSTWAFDVPSGAPRCRVRTNRPSLARS